MENRNIENIQECDIWTYNKLKDKEYITTYIKEIVKVDEETGVPYVERTPWIIYAND
ncbi:MAG: hypothetical protein ACRC7S_01340 [Cetobacterium sp.]